VFVGLLTLQADACVTDPKHRRSVQELLTRFLSPTFRKFDPEEEEREAAIADWALKPTRKWIYRTQRQTVLCSASIPQRQVGLKLVLLFFANIHHKPLILRGFGRV
jgi:hypothetical protein